MSSRFVDAYNVETGAKQRIPAHWLTHPVFGVTFAPTPSSKARAPTPSSKARARKDVDNN